MSTYSTLITNAKIVDGTGNPWHYGDVALAGDRIAAIAPPGVIDHAQAAEVVDASGHVVCPGFIDIQSHVIIPLMFDGRCLSKITQGITTEIMGEAWTPAPVGGRVNISEAIVSSAVLARLPEWAERMKGWRRFRDWLDAMIDHGVSPNIGSFLGGGTLREYAKGMEMGRANADELATMQRVMAEAMEDGAFGVSYALIYPPDCYVDTDELVEICKVVKRYNGVYISQSTALKCLIWAFALFGYLPWRSLLFPLPQYSRASHRLGVAQMGDIQHALTTKRLDSAG